MPFRNVLRKILLCIALGGHSVFSIGMSREKIEELLFAMNQTRVEVTITDSNESSNRRESPWATLRRKKESNIEEAITNES
jgi:hypothetical protein